MKLKMRYLGKKRMFKKLALTSLWFFTVPLLLLSSIFLLRQKNLSFQKPPGVDNNISIPEGTALETNRQIDGDVLGVEVSDLRTYMVASFLKKTPLEPYSDHMVQ